MAGNLDIARIEHATAIVKYRTMQLEIRARQIQLLVAGLALATAVVSAIACLLLFGTSGR